MNDRLISVVGALLALLIVVALLAPPRPAPATASAPTSVDRGAHGYYALAEWIRSANAPVMSLTRRYDALARAAAGRGNVLIATLPQRTPARSGERDALAAWVARGNTLVLQVAGSGRQPWLGSAGDLDISSVPAALGLDVSWETETLGDELAERGERIRNIVRGAEPGVESQPAGPHPLTAGVRRIAHSEASPLGARVVVTARDDARIVPALLRGDGTQQDDLWIARYRQGRVVVLADPGVFANRLLGSADNARLVNNLLGLVRASGGAVVFDDFHHGISELYDAGAFARDPRLHLTLLLLLGLWFVWIVGHGNRFGPLRQERRAESARDYADAVGSLFAREAAPAEIARALIAHFDRDCRRRFPRRLGSGPPGAALARLPGINAAEVRRLEAMRVLLTDGATPDLIDLTNCLHDLRKRL